MFEIQTDIVLNYVTTHNGHGQYIPLIEPQIRNPAFLTPDSDRWFPTTPDPDGEPQTLKHGQFRNWKAHGEGELCVES